jgi:hypothetical protein
MPIQWLADRQRAAFFRKHAKLKELMSPAYAKEMDDIEAFIRRRDEKE